MQIEWMCRQAIHSKLTEGSHRYQLSVKINITLKLTLYCIHNTQYSIKQLLTSKNALS